MAAVTDTMAAFRINFQVFYVCAALLMLKILFMVSLIGRYRFTKKIVISPEDLTLARGLKVKRDDPDLERVRRAHLNDIENIPIFVSVAFMYLCLKPSPFVAVPLLLAYTVARFTHTFVYAVSVKRQPARIISFSVGFAITAYMAGSLVYSLREAM